MTRVPFSFFLFFFPILFYIFILFFIQEVGGNRVYDYQFSLEPEGIGRKKVYSVEKRPPLAFKGTDFKRNEATNEYFLPVYFLVDCDRQYLKVNFSLFSTTPSFVLLFLLLL